MDQFTQFNQNYLNHVNMDNLDPLSLISSYNHLTNYQHFQPPYPHNDTFKTNTPPNMEIPINLELPKNFQLPFNLELPGNSSMDVVKPRVISRKRPKKYYVKADLRIDESCKHCGVSFNTKFYLKHHYTCNFCPKMMTNKRLFIEHVSKNHGAPYLCKVCLKEFDKWENFRQHRRKVHNKRSYHCLQCNQIFKYSFLYSRHMRDVHGVPIEYVHKSQEQPVKCTECDKIFAQSRLLRAHFERKHLERDMLTCSTCMKTFKTFAYMVKHKERVHQSHFDECPYCQQRFQPGALRQHVQAEHSDKPYKQGLARRVNKNEIGLRTDSYYHCYKCNKICTTKHILKYHIARYHYDGPEVFCKICDKTFSTAVGLKEHNKTVHPKTLQQCPKCPKTFKVKHAFKVHFEKNHSDVVKIHRCNGCMKKFKRLTNLQKHIANICSKNIQNVTSPFEVLEIKIEPYDLEDGEVLNDDDEEERNAGDGKSKGTDEKSKGTEERSKGTEEKSKVTDEKSEGTEEKSKGTDEESSDDDEVAMVVPIKQEFVDVEQN